MERTMSVEDKIRRAEEIYNRRRENEYRSTNTRVRVDNAQISGNSKINQRLKKMIVQIIVCLLIYLIFYYIINNNYIFSEDFKNKCEEILSYDISFNEMYQNISSAITTIKKKYQTNLESNEQNSENEEIQNENTNEENTEKINQEQQDTDNEAQNSEGESTENNAQNLESELMENEESQVHSDENIGGATEEIANVDKSEQTEELSEEEQMQKDADDIKSKISFIKPLNGTITSVFGWRNPTVETVSKYHKGIDIAANQGTDIMSATNGTVILSSSEGAYGNHLKIQIEEVIIIYAHCLSLEVKEGDQISQGQIIAKVGSTGNSTGPHLHFEIRKEDRYVDPNLILNFL